MTHLELAKVTNSTLTTNAVLTKKAIITRCEPQIEAWGEGTPYRRQ